MIVGFDAKRAFFNSSGLGAYSRNTIQLLSKYYPDNRYYLYTPTSKNAIDFTHDRNISIRQPETKTGRYLKSYWRSFLLTKQLEKDRVDIYHGLSNELPSRINRSHIKSVVTIHDLIFIRYPHLYKKIDREIYRRKIKYCCLAADKIAAISLQTKADIIEFFGVDESKIEVVYQGCNPLFYGKANNDTKKEISKKYHLPEHYILYVGTIEQRKNLLNIIRAVHEAGIDIPIVAVGKPAKYLQKVHEYIAQHSIDKKVHLLHNVLFDELPAIYQMAALFVYPSAFEGFGIPIIEAIYSGVPVITSKGGCFSEAGGNNSLYVDPDNIEELSFAINKVVSDNELKNRMIKTSLEYVRKFNDDAVARSLMNVYKNLIQHE
ncbi:MAG: glycosyltransferase family 4 protein [Bacteroidia bacterium]|nr:glycosyltransferase family 4 protein [Bacteroidia bacterium]